MKIKKLKQDGFTLIELLVVISIIGLLASVVLVSLNKTRIKSRDVTRLATLKQIVTALELYLSDNGHYPINILDSGGGYRSCFDCTGTIKDNPIINPNAPSIRDALLPYLKATPTDPKPCTGFAQCDGLQGYFYRTGSTFDGLDYKIISRSNPEDMRNFDPVLYDPVRCTLPIDANGRCASDWNSVGFWTPGGVTY